MCASLIRMSSHVVRHCTAAFTLHPSCCCCSIDVLVNNAGMGQAFPVAEVDIAAAKEVRQMDPIAACCCLPVLCPCALSALRPDDVAWHVTPPLSHAPCLRTAQVFETNVWGLLAMTQVQGMRHGGKHVASFTAQTGRGISAQTVQGAVEWSPS